MNSNNTKYDSCKNEECTECSVLEILEGSINLQKEMVKLHGSAVDADKMNIETFKQYFKYMELVWG